MTPQTSSLKTPLDGAGSSSPLGRSTLTPRRPAVCRSVGHGAGFSSPCAIALRRYQKAREEFNRLIDSINQDLAEGHALATDIGDRVSCASSELFDARDDLELVNAVDAVLVRARDVLPEGDTIPAPSTGGTVQ